MIKTGIRERGKAERRLRVVDGAVELLRSGGLEALSMRALSHEAGVSVPTIYNLVGGRDEVLAAVLGRLSTVFEAEVSVLTADPLDRCFDIADRLVVTINNHATLTRSIIGAGLAPMLAETDAALFPRFGLALVGALEEAAAADLLVPTVRPGTLVDQMVSLAAVRIFRWASEELSTDAALLEAAVTHGIGLLLAGAVSDRLREGVLARVTAAEARLPVPPRP